MCDQVEDVFKWLDRICDNESNYTDEELASKLKKVYDYCAGNNEDGSFYFITHLRSENILKKRAEKYCKKHKIKLEEYDGVLPYRKYIIKI